jgi:AAA domain
MIFHEPLLMLKRLVVLYKGIKVYDQAFHEGVNIIRGRNSSGKSTIVDFIFFVLGGDFVAWKPEAERCDNVIAELEINETIVTIRRRISELKAQPMEICWGRIETAIETPFTGWQVFSFRRSEQKESFSQTLFRMLGFPEARNEADSNITMHQILRLVCVDQLSNVLSIFRDEQFDSPLTRKTVGELLYGIYDDELYTDELRLRAMRRELERATVEHASLKTALSESDQLRSLRDIAEEVIETQRELKDARRQINQASSNYEIQSSPEPNEEFLIAESNLRAIKATYSNLSQEQGTLQFEVEDSIEFISNLEKRAIALDESVAAEEIIGKLALSVCPECMQPLDNAATEGHCFLCKKPVGETGRQKRVAKMRQELATQIKESKHLLENKETRLNHKTQEMRGYAQELEAAQRRFEDLAQRLKSKRDSALDDLLIRRGALEAKLEALEKQRRLAERLEELLKRIGHYKGQMHGLEERIKIASSKQDERRLEARSRVNALAVSFLRRDLPREDTFQVAQEVDVDFERNLCSVDRRVSFSASSITYLKAAVHFAIFFASLDLAFFRYPKFIVNDNIEDKGMEEGRSQNFQRLVVEYSQRAAVKHQIIFTTSMIAPELDGTELCVGPAYTRENKTLKFPNS